ncbi:MAG: SDR family NAD(P)-dependent oxidoreductase, partial [Desulfoprunum sp.]|nr:SDR family NAD(P)-dependent oxidoreductase [Desulfoprunum sp.]
MRKFENKVILVTGAGSGMGKAVALKLIKNGAAVVIADINYDAAKRVETEILRDGGKATAVKVDISVSAEVENMIKLIVDTYGKLDIAINNAGIEGKLGELIEQIPEMDFDRLFSVNVKGTWLCMKHELIQMKKQGFGNIVNMSSVLGTVGCPGFSSYAATKHAVAGLTRSAAVENAPLGIRINACCPAAVQTPMLDRATGID